MTNTDTNTQTTALLELIERLETVAAEAQHQLREMRTRPDGYTASEVRRLSDDLESLRNRCDNVRYAVTKDAAMPTIHRLDE